MELTDQRIRGVTDGLEAMPQTIYCILNTERSRYLAYSDSYGAELENLLGMPLSFVIPEIERRITDALIWDSRIESVDSFRFETGRGSVHVTFTVHTVYGDVDAEKAVFI